MKSFLLAAKIAAFFTLVTGILLAGALNLFLSVSGHEMMDDIGLLRAHQGVVVAERIEALLDEHPIDSQPVRDLIATESRSRALSLTLETENGVATGTPRLPPSHGFHQDRVLEISGRLCHLAGPPTLEGWVPVRRDGRTVAYLVSRGSLDLDAMHDAFLRGLLYLGAIGSVCVLGLALYLTAPLRRMSRSMDQIAAGDLGHRVADRGSGEVAVMGRSFNAMADRIRDMLGGQKELMAGVSHELRSPLTRMKMQLELLRGQPERAGRIDEIESEIDHLDALVEELLLASRFDLGSVELAAEDLDLEAAIYETWSVAEAGAVAPLLSLTVEIAPDARRVHADPSLLRRILGNLFENAHRYAAGGSVQVLAERRGGEIEVTVADDGPGVPDEHLDRLFEPFFRVDSSRSRKTGASGLGLMIVRRSVESHGGTLHAVRSGQGGLAITFSLPVEPGPSGF